jgi:hypothetical protein
LAEQFLKFGSEQPLSGVCWILAIMACLDQALQFLHYTGRRGNGQLGSIDIVSSSRHYLALVWHNYGILSSHLMR